MSLLFRYSLYIKFTELYTNKQTQKKQHMPMQWIYVDNTLIFYFTENNVHVTQSTYSVQPIFVYSSFLRFFKIRQHTVRQYLKRF